ncbi:hypothetical protein LY78DRAFT_205343 [Colletotrichum sublineola]|nr:hypothetical protein LY78DRAFT_205343 [Colletotrichum sublineola]
MCPCRIRSKRPLTPTVRLCYRCLTLATGAESETDSCAACVCMYTSRFFRGQSGCVWLTLLSSSSSSHTSRFSRIETARLIVFSRCTGYSAASCATPDSSPLGVSACLPRWPLPFPLRRGGWTAAW